MNNNYKAKPITREEALLLRSDAQMERERMNEEEEKRWRENREGTERWLDEESSIAQRQKARPRDAKIDRWRRCLTPTVEGDDRGTEKPAYIGDMTMTRRRITRPRPYDPSTGKNKAQDSCIAKWGRSIVVGYGLPIGGVPIRWPFCREKGDRRKTLILAPARGRGRGLRWRTPTKKELAELNNPSPKAGSRFVFDV